MNGVQTGTARWEKVTTDTRSPVRLQRLRSQLRRDHHRPRSDDQVLVQMAIDRRQRDDQVVVSQMPSDTLKVLRRFRRPLAVEDGDQQKPARHVLLLRRILCLQT